jgi:molecular chaperone IbpA
MDPRGQIAPRLRLCRRRSTDLDSGQSKYKNYLLEWPKIAKFSDFQKLSWTLKIFKRVLENLFGVTKSIAAGCQEARCGRRRVSGALLISMLLTEDVAMRTMNLDPFWRTSIGFDRLFDLMDESLRFEPEDHYPPCNIVRTGENTYRISLAVAGFKPEQVSVTVNQNVLIVSASAEENKQDNGEYLYRGIAGRSFERRFNLADYVTVKGASLDDGLLQIELERELPEAMKPRRIEIQSGKPGGKGDNVRTIEHSKVA